MHKKVKISIDEVIKKIKEKNSNFNEDLIRKAYNFANKSHKEQKRLSGDAFITHPLAVAYILADLELDDSTICAALLHDVLEDTSVSRDEVVNEFGEEITEMVDGVTKLRKNSIF